MGHGLASNLMHGGSPTLSYDTEANVMSFNPANPQVMGGTLQRNAMIMSHHLLGMLKASLDGAGFQYAGLTPKC